MASHEPTRNAENIIVEAKSPYQVAYETKSESNHDSAFDSAQGADDGNESYDNTHFSDEEANEV